MGASLLAQPGVDDGLSACCGGVEPVPDGFLVESDQCEHDLVVGGEPADDPDGDVGVIGVGDPPQLMTAGLLDSLEGGGFRIRLGREVVGVASITDGVQSAAGGSALDRVAGAILALPIT
jgi:hypothetical protein